MPPEDGDPAIKPDSDAFAETVAPPPSKLPTPAPPPIRAEAALPAVDESNYAAQKELARGGMGKIFAATDVRLGRPVAVKQLLEPSPEQITRFKREALITARLQHPGIVPVYEAGTWASGEPFFAMKLVQGKPLDRVIAQATRLEDRLAIIPRLTAACDAIAYAHDKRIIHRDLKPANVLLGDFGETVVIDWGLAKDLDDNGAESVVRKPRPSEPRVDAAIDSSTLTVAGAVMGTPAYMAPEQACGEPVDQRADVFALGAMLYHTLTGMPPYNARTATEVIAAAALARVVPLRDREKRAPADLVAIVERAMAAEPHDRYPDAGELADELRRFLTGQLVDAHRYTAWQKVGRFVRKHQAAVTVSALALVGFAVGGTFAVRRVVAARDIARREQQIAVTRKQAAERLIDYMFSDMKKRLAEAGRLDMLAGMGTEVKRYYTLLADLPGGMPLEDELRMAEAITLIGMAEHTSGNPDQALATWRAAREHTVAIVGDDKTERTRPLRHMIARFDYETGRIFQERGKNDSALEYFKRAQAADDALAAEAPAWNEILLETADIDDRLGDLLRVDGKIDEAFEQYTSALQKRQKVSDDKLALSTSHFKLGSVYQNRGDSSVALDEYRQALELRDALLAAQPDNVELQQAVLEVEREMGELQRQLGDETGAIETYRRALPVAAALVRTDPRNTDWQYQRGNLLSDLGFTLIDSGAYSDGLKHITDAITVQQDLVERDRKSSKYKTSLSRSQTRAGDAEVDLGKLADGIAQYRAALEIRRDLVDTDAKSTAYRRSIAWSYAKLARAFELQGDDKLARDAYGESLRLRKQLVDESPSQGGFKNELAASEIALGQIERSTELVRQGTQRARLLVMADPINIEWKETLTQGLLAQHAYADALTIALDATARAPQNAHWPCYVAEIYVGLGQWKQAREILEGLDKDGRLPWPRRSLLERARAHR